MNIKSITTALTLATLSTATLADTTQTGPNSYTIDEGVTFTILSQAANSFLLSWSDDSGTFTDIADPTITLSSGQTYIFDNNTFSHPFRMTTDALPVTGTDGSYVRDTFDIAVIDGASMQPVAEFTADPEPAVDVITWTPGDNDAGEYYYTCLVLAHANMIGKIIVEAPASCPADLTGDGMLNFFDVSAFLSAYNAMDLAADFTGDGMFNFFDVSAFLSAFNAGCP